MASLLKVNNLTKEYREKNNKTIVKALNGVSFSLESGKVLGIIGESGCGKSTLGRLLISLEKSTNGYIEFQGERIEDLIKKDQLGFRRQCQMIFQNPFDTFDPRNTIGKILMETLKIHSIGRTKEEQRNICIDVMEQCGMNPAMDYLNRYPHELSGGQLQRISVIRSILLSPKLIIADEPVSMLDVSVRADIINTLSKFTKDQRAAMIFISHDIATTRYISDEIAVMYLGKIVEIGNVNQIISNPKHPYTKVLISNCGSIDPFQSRNIIKISGEPPKPVDLQQGCYFASRCYKKCDKCTSAYPQMIEIEKNHYASCFYL